MTPKEFGLFLISLLASVAGQFFLKTGANQLGQVTSGNAVSLVLKILTTPALLAGLTCYGLGAVFYILVLTRVDLSVAGPAIALSYVFALLVGLFVFKEAIPITRYIGLGLIVAGVILVIFKKA